MRYFFLIYNSPLKNIYMIVMARIFKSSVCTVVLTYTRHVKMRFDKADVFVLNYQTDSPFGTHFKKYLISAARLNSIQSPLSICQVNLFFYFENLIILSLYYMDTIIRVERYAYTTQPIVYRYLPIHNIVCVYLLKFPCFLKLKCSSGKIIALINTG